MYEILNDEGAVINRIVADEAFVQAHYPGHYRLVPEPPVVIPKRKILTRYEFRALFTIEEKAAIITAAKTDPIIEVFNTDMMAAEEINLDYPDVTQGLAYLVALNLITQQKMDDILGGV